MELKNEKKILVINCGSSSIKFSLFTIDPHPEKQFSGKIDRIGISDTTLSWHDLTNDKTGNEIIGNKFSVNIFIDWLNDNVSIANITAIGHRVVHGMKRSEPELVSQQLLVELNRIAPFDPDHLPQEIEMIETFQKRYAALPQIACFDTAFHAHMPAIAKLLPIPRRYHDMGIQRYGFHGLSYAYIMEELVRMAGDEVAKGKIILAHLGNGASLAAIKEGKSQDTSMGFTPVAGLVMGTRTGDLDPGVAWFMMDKEKLNAGQFSDLVNHQSGLLGVSGTSSDMQDLLKNQRLDEHAADAIELFCYQTKKWIGSFAAVLGGLDTLVFTGGIGENAPEIRSRVSGGLQFLGIEIDEKRNADNEEIISADNSRVTVRVIKTNEELMIAKSVYKLLNFTAS